MKLWYILWFPLYKSYRHILRTVHKGFYRLRLWLSIIFLYWLLFKRSGSRLRLSNSVVQNLRQKPALCIKEKSRKQQKHKPLLPLSWALLWLEVALKIITEVTWYLPAVLYFVLFNYMALMSQVQFLYSIILKFQYSFMFWLKL